MYSHRIYRLSRMFVTTDAMLEYRFVFLLCQYIRFEALPVSPVCFRQVRLFAIHQGGLESIHSSQWGRVHTTSWFHETCNSANRILKTCVAQNASLCYIVEINVVVKAIVWLAGA